MEILMVFWYHELKKRRSYHELKKRERSNLNFLEKEAWCTWKGGNSQLENIDLHFSSATCNLWDLRRITSLSSDISLEKNEADNSYPKRIDVIRIRVKHLTYTGFSQVLALKKKKNLLLWRFTHSKTERKTIKQTKGIWIYTYLKSLNVQNFPN